MSMRRKEYIKSVVHDTRRPPFLIGDWSEDDKNNAWETGGQLPYDYSTSSHGSHPFRFFHRHAHIIDLLPWTAMSCLNT